MEGSKDPTPPPIPPRSTLRHSTHSKYTLTQSPRWSLRSQDTLLNSPSAFGFSSTSLPADGDLTAPVEGEKLAQLRREPRVPRRKGGWFRLAIALVVVSLLVGLAVGLGVGLTIGRNSNGSNNAMAANATASTNPNAGANDEPIQDLPLGEYSFITALRSEQTNCSANAAAWRCFPYVTYDNSNTSSLATFNWAISNTSSAYATNVSSSTSSQGIPANLTISSVNNPFAISFVNQSLTYISDSANISSSRYTFSFMMSKEVVPSPAITSDDAASQCFFNATNFAGTIYLNAPGTSPDAARAQATGAGGYAPWPYAVEVSQTALGGSNVPNCYETSNGVIGSRILTGLTPQPTDSQCICDYRNF